MPWDNPEMYDKWSPSQFVKEFQTPTLVIHGELDFRVPYTQGLQLFTALQMQKVPSELLIFPDEGHWVLKPQNSALWYKTFLDWVDNWTKKVKAYLIDSSSCCFSLQRRLPSLLSPPPTLRLTVDPPAKVIGFETPIHIRAGKLLTACRALDSDA